MKPQPLTFAERLRGLMSLALFGAGLVCTAMAVGEVLIIWRGGWPNGTEAQRIAIIGWALLGAMAGMGAVIISLAIGGPVGRFKANAGRDGVGFEAEDRDDTQPVVTTTTTTAVATPTPGATQ